MNDANTDNTSICDRLRAVREEAFGPRGRAAFARALGLSPSTYIYYEKGRTPPADVLARAAQVAGVRLEWLVTGSGPRERAPEDVRREAQADLPPALQPAVDRLLAQLGDRHSPAAVRALAELLAQVGARFPGAGRDEAWTEGDFERPDGMVPILGRTAAGLVGTYEELLGEAPAVTVADIARRAVGVDVRSRPAARVETDDPASERAVDAAATGVSLVQLDRPLPSGVVEFIDAPAIRAAHPAAFALRVDGESMSPRFRHGDVVIAVAGGDVRAGQAALVKIRGRVGVTLKLVRRDGRTVHLVPINETYDTESLDESEIEWIAPVLFAARFGATP